MILDNKKLFLNTNEIKNNIDTVLVDTFTVFGIRNVLLDYNVSLEKKLDKIKIIFIKDSINNDRNPYFNSSITLDGQNIDVKSVNSDILGNLDSNNFEKNRIKNYSGIYNASLEFENVIEIPPVAEDGSLSLYYDLFFTVDNPTENRLNTIWKNLEIFYTDNPQENFKFLLHALDQNNNIIDSTNIIEMAGVTANYPLKLEYDEIIELYKNHLYTNLEIGPAVSFNGLNIDGIYIKEYDSSHSPADNPVAKSHYTREPKYFNSDNTEFNSWMRFPSLNKSYANFILNELKYSKENVDKELTANTDSIKTVWIHGSVSGTESLDETIGDNRLMDPDELARFNLIKKLPGAYLTYVSRSGNSHQHYARASKVRFNSEDRDTWVSRFSFLSNQGLESNLLDQLLADYESNDSFDFFVQIPYRLTSYQESWDEDFSISKRFTLNKTEEFNELINNVVTIKARSNFERNFIVTNSVPYRTELSDTEKSIFKFKITRNPSSSDNTLLQNNLLLMNVSYPLVDDFSTPAEVVLFQTFNESTGELTDPFSLGQNYFIEDLLNRDLYFYLNPYGFISSGAANYTNESGSELSLNFQLFYNGGFSNISYPIDIVGGIYLFKRPYFFNLMNENESSATPFFSEISFKTIESPEEPQKLFDFDLKINKERANELSRQLLYGNNAAIRNVDDETSPIFLEDLLIEIRTVNYVFKNNGIEIGRFSKENTDLKKGIYLAIDEFDKESDINYHLYTDIISKYSDLELNRNDLNIVGDDSDPNHLKIYHAFFNEFNSMLPLDVFSHTDRLSFSIEVKYRFFIFPKGLNKRHEIVEPNNNWSNIHEKIPDITLDIKSGLISQFIDHNPNASIDSIIDLAYKWLTRTYGSELNKREKYNNVKSFFYGPAGSTSGYYLQSQSEDSRNVTFNASDFLILSENYEDNVTHYWDLNYNTTLISGNLELRSNLICFMSLIDNNPQFEIKVNPNSPSSTPYLTLTSTISSLESLRINSIFVSFIPEIFDYHVNKSKINSNNGHLVYTKNSRVYLKTQWTSVSGWNMTSENELQINLSQAGYVVPKNFKEYKDLFNERNPNSIIRAESEYSSEGSRNRRMTTSNIFKKTKDHYGESFTFSQEKIEDILENSFLVKSFNYRIRILLSNGLSIYKKVKIPVRIAPRLSELFTSGEKTKYTNDKLLINNLYRNDRYSFDDAQKYVNERGLRIYNLSAFPWRRISSTKEYKYKEMVISNVPGFNYFEGESTFIPVANSQSNSSNSSQSSSSDVPISMQPIDYGVIARTAKDASTGKNASTDSSPDVKNPPVTPIRLPLSVRTFPSIKLK